MSITQKSINKAFALGVLGLYAFGFGATLGAKTHEYTRVIGDYALNNNLLDQPVNVLMVDSENEVVVNGLNEFAQPSINASYNVNNVVNNINVSVSSNYETQDGQPWGFIGYNVQLSSLRTDCDNYVNISTNKGTLPLKITFSQVQRTGYDWYSIRFTYNSENPYFSNLFFHNFVVYDDDDDDHYYNMPCVFFNGNADIMDSTEDTQYGFDYAYGHFPYLYFRFNFTLSIVPSSMIASTDVYQNGYDSGYNVGYNAGRDYVLSHLDEFNLYDYASYLAYGQSQYNDGLEAGSNVLSLSSVMNTIFTAPISMFMQIFRSGAFVWTMPTGEVLDLGGLMTFFLTIGIALAVVRLIMKVGGK